MTGLNHDPKPSFSQASQSDFDASETETSASYSICSEDLKDEHHGVILESKRNSNKKDTSMKIDHPEPGLGWPLLRTTPKISQNSCLHNMSVVQWVMNLPDRSPSRVSTKEKNDPSRSEPGLGILSDFSEPPEDLEYILKTNSSTYKWFSPDVLKASTSHFSSGFRVNPRFKLMVESVLSSFDS